MSLHTDTATAFSVAVRQAHVQGKDERGQGSILCAVLATVVAVDQATKWWAWRNASGTMINEGASPFVGTTVSAWYEDRVSGALLDFLAVGLLGIAVSVLARRRRPVLVLIPGALMIGGWSSNLLDRLGMHHWTAPRSSRGAVDFIPLGSLLWNVADLYIVVGTSLCLLVAASAPRRRGNPAPGR
jgi:lipoprotein signal peptidase